MNFVQKKRSGLSNERLDFFQTCCNAKNVNISENGDQIDEEVLNEIFGFSRREFVNWGAAGASLCSLFDPSSASAKPAKDPTEQESYNPTIPYSSVRQYKSIKFSNGMQVLLVSDKNARQATAALTIGGAGQFSDPTDLNGLAHLMEHMVLSSPNSRRRIASKSQDFEDWLSDYDGASNGFTAYEKVCFHFNCLTEIFPDALERFARLFLQEVIQKNCRNEETLKREVRRVNSELDSSNGFFRELYLIKSLINPEHPYARLSKGSLESLETIPAKLGLDVGQSLIKFFKERYQPSKAILVVVSRSDLTSLETWVAPFASTLSRERVEEEPQRVFPEFFPTQNRISTICLFRQKSSTVVGEDLEKLSFQWALNLDYSGAKQSGRSIVTATQIGFVLSQIFGRRGPGSLYTLLRKRGWIPEGSQGLPRIIFPVDVPGFQLMKLEISLTLEGFSSRSSVIAAVYDSINSLQFSSIPTAPFRLKRELIAEYATVAQLYGYVLSPRPPDAVELAFDGQLYGVDVPRATGNPEWLRFPSPKDSIGVLRIQKCLQDTLVFMSDPANAIIIATASNKAIQFAKQNVLDNSLPPMSPASWDISPVSGARYYFDNMFRLSGKVNEWLVARLLEDELSPPVLNPLIPPMLSPARILDSRGFTEESSPLLLNSDVEREGSRLKRLMQRSRRDVEDDGSDPETYDDPTKSSLVRDYWAVLQVLSHEKSALSLRLPRAPPEPSGRCVFVLQLISSRPARAKVKSAAHAELWKMSLEYAVSDLVGENNVSCCYEKVFPGLS